MSKALRTVVLNEISKILVIRLGPFGDVLLTTSYFETLKKRMPQAELHYLMKEPYQAAVENHPFIDRLVVIPKRRGVAYYTARLSTIRNVRRERYDLVIDHQGQPSSQQITFFSGARFRLGYADTRFPQAYNLKAYRGPLRYSASAKFDILKPLGLCEEPYTIYFHIPADAQDYAEEWLDEQKLLGDHIVLVSPGSPVPRKQWRIEYFARLCELIVERLGLTVVLLWAPDEREDCMRILAMARRNILLAPPTTLQQAAAFLKRCRLLICNDGGLNHLAVSTGTTTLAIFGSEDPLLWSPASVFHHHHHLHVTGHRSRDNSFGISPEMAYAEVERILQPESMKHIGV